MDPDSFLSHLFLDFDEFDYRYNSSQAHDQPFKTAQNIGITNIDAKLPTDLDPLEKSMLRSLVNSSFSSVLKLSDIACVLEKLSKPFLCSEFLNSTPVAAHDQLAPTFHSSLTKHSPSPEKRPKLLESFEIRSNNNDACKADNVDGARKRISKDGLSQREIHIQAERQRRKSMADYFTLVPKLRLKHADRITVFTELITYIQSLRDTMKELDEKKTDLLTTLGLSEEDCHYASQEHWNACISLLSDLNAHRKPWNQNIQLSADSHAQVTGCISPGLTSLSILTLLSRKVFGLRSCFFSNDTTSKLSMPHLLREEKINSIASMARLLTSPSFMLRFAREITGANTQGVEQEAEIMIHILVHKLLT